MGADLILATVELREPIKDCRKRLENLVITEEDLGRLEDCGFFGFTDEEWSDDLQRRVKERISDAIEVVYGCDGNRDVSGIIVDSQREFRITGGTSWGEEPSAEYDDFCIFNEFVGFPFWADEQSPERLKWEGKWEERS